MKPPEAYARGIVHSGGMCRAIVLCSVASLLLLALPSQPAHPESFAPLQRYREVRYVMGTLLDITLYHRDGQKARASLNKAFSLAHTLDGLLSNYKPQSEVSRLNQKGGRGRIPVSAEVYDLLSEAKRLSLKTEGAFDITVGPLLGLWRSADREDKMPDSGSLREALELVGINQLIIHPGREVELRRAGVRIDTGGIGKGYAVDRIAGLFKIDGTEAALINFGHSSVMAIGSPPNAEAWTLLLRFPEHDPIGLVRLEDQAFAASDSLSRSFEIAGRRYGHLIDPRSGTPVSEMVQAAIVAPSATAAEAFSKYVVIEGCNRKIIPGRSTRTWALRIHGTRQTPCTDGFPLLLQRPGSQ